MPQIEPSLLNRIPNNVRELIEKAPLSGLGDSPKCKATPERIRVLLAGEPAYRGSLIEAGLWLLAGDLNRSHEISQNLETAEGSYWHGIMHRREGDFWNAKYWFRKVGRHPVVEQLANHLSLNQAIADVPGGNLPLRELSSPTKVLETLVDSCERALSAKPEHVSALQRICWLEWQFLFLYGCDNQA